MKTLQDSEIEQKVSVTEYIKTYFDNVNKYIVSLSNKQEKYLNLIPHWCFTYDIMVLYFEEVSHFKIYVNPYNGKHGVSLYCFANKEEFARSIDFIKKWLAEGHSGNYHMSISADLYPTADFPYIEFLGESITSDNPKAINTMIQGYSFSGNVQAVYDKYSEESAKATALSIWNAVLQGESFSSTQVNDLSIKNTISTLERLIHRKEYVERKIHRYINEYSHVLLPSHKNCYFEKKLYDRQGNFLVADFILERDFGMPPLLIELERPWLKLYRKDNELTAEANHAKNQIADWVRYIDSNSDNFEEGFDFLEGKKERLVIGGRGLDNLDQMLNLKHEDTKIWTYTLLIREAKIIWNKEFDHQYKAVGINKQLPFPTLL